MIKQWTHAIFNLVKDRPEWKYATVDGDGHAYFWNREPIIFEERQYWIVHNCVPGILPYLEIDGIFEASNWRNSLLKRGSCLDNTDSEIEKSVKKGIWLWDVLLGVYCYIEERNHDRIFTVTQDGQHPIYAIEDFSEGKLRLAKIRPWTFEEAPIVLKVRCKRTGATFVANLTHKGDCYQVVPGEPAIHRDIFVERYEQLDHFPCGVLEHE